MLGFLIFGIAMYLQLSYSLAAGRDRTLRHRAQRVITLLNSCGNEKTADCASKYDDFAAATPEGNLIFVFTEQGQPLYSTKVAPEKNFPRPLDLPSTSLKFSKVPYDGAIYRMLAEPVTIGSKKLCIIVGGQLSDNRANLRQFRNGLLWATPVFLALSAIFGYLVSVRALRPVARLISSFRSISIGNLSKRLPPIHSGDELEALTETCNEMLARLDTAVGQIKRFTTDASHELRSPISYIYTLSECAQRNPVADKESAESFAEIVRECREATHLLDNMLSLARFDSGQTELVFERINLTDILNETCLRAAPFAEEKQHNLRVEISWNEPAWIMGDASSLRRLFWIMLDNAIKYTPPRGEITVSLRKDGNQVRVNIQDTGIGIPQGALPEIFERFYRVDKARSFADGTGLGLSIAKWISDIHHCDLSVESRENSGSIFKVAFGILESAPFPKG